MIQHNDLQPEERAKLENQPIDEEKPGLGQHVGLIKISIDRRTVLMVSLHIFDTTVLRRMCQVSNKLCSRIYVSHHVARAVADTTKPTLRSRHIGRPRSTGTIHPLSARSPPS